MSSRKHGYMRRPRTTQERRWNEAHRKYVRGRRSPKLIPCAWEDKYKSKVYTKSWKARSKKKKQWMPTNYREGWTYRLGPRNTRHCDINCIGWVYRCPGSKSCPKRSLSYS